MKSKFLKLYNLIMEEISKNELEHIKLSTDNFINNLKNVFFIVDALKRVRELDSKLDFKMIFVGTGQDEDALKKNLGADWGFLDKLFGEIHKNGGAK